MIQGKKPLLLKCHHPPRLRKLATSSALTRDHAERRRICADSPVVKTIRGAVVSALLIGMQVLPGGAGTRRQRGAWITHADLMNPSYHLVTSPWRTAAAALAVLASPVFAIDVNLTASNTIDTS